MNLKLQTVQPEFLAKLLQDVELFKTDVNHFVNEYTDKSAAANFLCHYRCTLLGLAQATQLGRIFNVTHQRAAP